MVCEKCEKKGKLGKVINNIISLLVSPWLQCNGAGDHAGPLEGGCQQHDQARREEGGGEQAADRQQEQIQPHDHGVQEVQNMQGKFS